jgi:hypothetical protein
MKKRATTRSLKGQSKDDQQGGSTVNQQARRATTNSKGRGQKAEARASSTKRGGQQRVPVLLGIQY